MRARCLRSPRMTLRRHHCGHVEAEVRRSSSRYSCSASGSCSVQYVAYSSATLEHAMDYPASSRKARKKAPDGNVGGYLLDSGLQSVGCEPAELLVVHLVDDRRERIELVRRIAAHAVCHDHLGRAHFLVERDRDDAGDCHFMQRAK